MTATLGILMLDTMFPRIPGDIGNTRSYNFPVLLKTVRGATVQRVVFDADPTLLDDFVAGARELEAAGVSAITSSCGFLAPLQQRVAQSVNVPVFLSSLMQIPLVHAMTGKRVAVLTANAGSLNEVVLRSAGVTEQIPLAIAGLEDVAAFRDPILQDGSTLQADVIEAAILEKVASLLVRYPDIAAIVSECHNLAPYSWALQTRFRRPVFDIIGFAHWVYRSIESESFPRT